MAAKELDLSGVIDQIRQLTDRVATEKQIRDLSDKMKSYQDIVEERFSTIAARLKAMESREEEKAETAAKEHTKTRTVIKEKLEDLPSKGGDSDEPPKWLQPVLLKLNDGFSFFQGIMGEKEVKDTFKAKIVGALGGGKDKKPAAGSDE